MLNSMDTQEIIDTYIKPRVLPEECRRLKIPPEFIKGVYTCWPKLFDYHALCTPVVNDGHITEVVIKIGTDYQTPSAVLHAFRHEVRHAKDYFIGRNPSELTATLYTFVSDCEDLLNRTII